MEPKLGIIGCGGIAKFHFDGLKKIGAKVVHLADISEAAAKPYAEMFGAQYSNDYKDLLKDPEVTAVCVLTGSFLHKEICLAALTAGKDVLCEKTLTTSAADALELANAAEQSGRIFVTAYMKRFFPAVIKAKELVGKLGTLYSAQVRAYHQWGNLYDRDIIPQEKIDEFNGILRRNGSLVLMCSGSHMIDMTMNLMGRPDSVYANIDYIEDTNLERRATALLEYDSGLVVHFEAAANPLMKVGLERNGFDEFVKISGTLGRLELYTVSWDKPENNGMLVVHYDETTGTSTEYRFDPINPFNLEVEAFCKALASREALKPDVVDGFNVDTLIAAMFESGQKKCSVRIDWKGK